MMAVDPDTQAAIDEFTGGEEPTRKIWMVDDESSADENLELIASAQRKLDRAADVHRASIQRADDWLRKETKKTASWVALLTGQLEAWFHKLYTAKHKSMSLPAGRVAFRKQPPKVEVVDDDAAWAWAKAKAPHIIATRSVIDLSELAKHFKATGELPDGAKLVERPPKFHVKTNGGSDDDDDENGPAGLVEAGGDE